MHPHHHVLPSPVAVDSTIWRGAPADHWGNPQIAAGDYGQSTDRSTSATGCSRSRLSAPTTGWRMPAQLRCPTDSGRTSCGTRSRRCSWRSASIRALSWTSSATLTRHSTLRVYRHGMRRDAGPKDRLRALVGAAGEHDKGAPVAVSAALSKPVTTKGGKRSLEA